MIRYEKKNSLITQQAEAEQKFLETFEAGAYTASSPLVVRNPYLISPLTAMILFKTAVKQEVTLTVKGRSRKAISAIHFRPIRSIFFRFMVCMRTAKIRWSSFCREENGRRL